MLRTQNSLATAVVLTFLTALACDTAPMEPESLDSQIVQRVAELGFQTDSIQDFGSYVVVEGDIRLEKDRLSDYGTPETVDGLQPQVSRQARTSALVGATVSNMKVAISTSVSSAWADATRQAMAEWNAVQGTKVHFVEGSPANITVSMQNQGANNLAAIASWPSSGLPGPTITINSYYSLSSAERKHVMVHEFGHTFGLRHTDWDARNESDAIHITGTPTSDAASVMNGIVKSWSGFSLYDKRAVLEIYRKNPTVSISYPNGNPYLTWSHPDSPSSYTVTYWEHWSTYDGYGGYYEVSYDNERYHGSATSVTDTEVTYTGSSKCDSGDTELETEYVLEAHFAHGTTMTAINARTCPL